MNLFSDCLDRLKPMLRVSKDQEVAAALGLSKTAFSERKKRGSFPDRELRALAQERPDLNIDVDYVLTGVAQAAHEIIQAAIAGTPLVKVRSDELQLLESYRFCTPEDKKLLLLLLKRLSQAPSTLTPDGRYTTADSAAPLSTLHDKSA